MLEPLRFMVGMCLVSILTLSTPAYGACDTVDLSEPTNDCDEDGVTVGDGDCDDEDPMVSPDEAEVCFDDIDNNCDNEVDEECEEFPDTVMLSGGGQCGLGLATPLSSWVFVWALLIRRREYPC